MNQTELTVTRLAVETVTSMMGPLTAKRLIECPGLLLAVVRACDRDETAPAAAQALKRVAAHLGACDRRHPLLVAALVKLSSSPNALARMWVSRAFLEQSRLASSGFFIARTTAVLSIVLRLSRDGDASVQAAATEALCELGSTRTNLKQLLAQATVISTMVDNAMSFDPDCRWKTRTNRYAIKLILLLVDCEGAIPRIAREYNLTLCLATFAVSRMEEKELKQACLEKLIVLASFL
jgi:hypothetical protein